MSRILIVDDSVQNRESLKLVLQDENPDWHIFTAQSAVECRVLIEAQISKNEYIDVVLTDLAMESESSGMDVLREARKLDPLIMSILFTSRRTVDRHAAYDLGAFDVIQKNMIGAVAAHEINIKTRAALRYRVAVRHEEISQRINYLRRYFDPRVFETIEREPSLLDVKYRTITICFWDIRGFSALCEILKAHPTLISGFLKDYCEVAAQTIFQNNGLLDKFIGDGVMALFGVLNHKDDNGKADALAAVQSAFDLRPKFDEVYKHWLEQWTLYTPHKIDIGLGCGIHTGNVLVGNVGTEFRDQLTALGPDVNFASRIEGRAESGQILLSQTTESRVHDRVKSTKTGEISDIKNIPGTFEIYSVEPL